MNDERNERLGDDWVKDLDEFYGNGLKNFMGYHFKVATNPWSHHVQAAALPEDTGNYVVIPESF